MRSLGLSPTINELTQYLKKKKVLSFADFLDIMHIVSIWGLFWAYFGPILGLF
jgi:hypothetical protein